MPESSVSYSELTRRVVREASEPLPFGEIVRRVEAIKPITTRHPKATIRAAITNTPLVVATGDRLYAWKPRLLSGAVLRLPLTEASLAVGHLAYPDEVRDSLYPGFFGSQHERELGVAVAVLPDGGETPLALDHAVIGGWG